ncbi:hypothetical protein ACW5XW_23830 [Aeromonas piscicola]|uniref:hypothetical protein n=1 Tax=Aeromonas piscicola TaxID=600645 RepID=UPI0005B4C931|nr:hypothetical protein [Aeromonas piscicola]
MIPVELLLFALLVVYIFVAFAIAQAGENNRGTNFVTCMTIGIFTSPIGSLLYIFYHPNSKKDRQHAEWVELLKNK